MGLMEKLFFVCLLIFSAAIDGTRGDAMVTGTVFCDQCKDGENSLFDYPIYGVKVKVNCVDRNGQITMSREETTNWFGNYAMKFDGAPDLSNCFAQVSSTGQGSSSSSSDCTAAAGSAQQLRLMFRMFDMELYSVSSLLTEPAKPMPYCPKSTNPVPPPFTPVAHSSPPPVLHLPPLPPLPTLPPMPPMPFVEASACTHENWTAPEYKCYWRAVNPESKVAIAFGLNAARVYGNDMTLWQGLQGRGDPYMTLLREGVTSYLNSLNSLQFPYNTLGVVQHMNWALMGSPRSVLLTALRFMRANAGSSYNGLVTCKFKPCV